MFQKIDDATYCIALPREAKVIETLTNFCIEQRVHNGYFSGIGAVDQLSCGYYDLPEKVYRFSEYNELLEVVSLQGNIILKDDVPFIHAHGTFTNTDNQAFGGHLQEMRVGITLEVFLHALPSTLKRSHDEYSGLYLIDTDPTE